MELWLIEFINKYGYFAICFLIAFENIFPPIPSEIILTFGGFMTHSSNLEIPLVIIFSTIGSLIGALVLYFVGSIFNKDKIIKLLSTKVGRSLHIQIMVPDVVYIINLVRGILFIPAGIDIKLRTIGINLQTNTVI